MTNDELKQLCERLIRYPDPNQWHVERTSLAIEMLRLLAENERMRGVVEAARMFFTSTNEGELRFFTAEIRKAIATLDKLPPGAEE